MATVKSFKGVRPNESKAALVAALPYDVMSSEEARDMTKDNPYSFLHVDKAEIDLDPSIDIHDPLVYEKAKENLNDMIAKGIFEQDKSPCMYIYKLTMDGREQTGLVACTSIDEYLEGIIKKHELTRADKEIDRTRHIDVCNAQTGPIFLAYRGTDELNTIINNWMDTHKAVYDFVADDNIGHAAWVIDDQGVIDSISKGFASVPNLYIADGHHRNASAVNVGVERRKKTGGDTTAEFNFYLSVIFPQEQLCIMDYNRVIKDLNGLSKDKFFSLLGEKFDIWELKNIHPSSPHRFSMYLEGMWYGLELKDSAGVNLSDPVEALDVSILQEHVLKPILGINDPRTDKRIDFVGGVRGLEELEKRVNSGEMQVAFALYPTSMEELLAVADAGKIMPPKSTWFEPKLRSGLFIHSLE